MFFFRFLILLVRLLTKRNKNLNQTKPNYYRARDIYLSISISIPLKTTIYIFSMKNKTKNQ